MKYRATCTIIWDFESEQTYEEALQHTRKQLDQIPVQHGMEDIRVVVQLDKLKKKVEKVKLGEFSIDDVMPFVSQTPCKKEYEAGGKKYLVKMNSDRYLTFIQNMNCVACGLSISKIFLECHLADMTPHFNMYGEEEGKFVLFTKDHIQAKAFGGEDEISNYQTMCATCNSLKAHSNLDVESVKKLRVLYDQNKKSLTKKKLHLLIEESRIKLEQPWSHDFVKTGDPTKDSLCLRQDLAICEVEGSFVGLAKTDMLEDYRVIGAIGAGSWLAVVLEINDFYFCSMFRDKVVKIHKTMFGK